ncbi:MAG: NADP-dependent oxidoreductase [Propionibacterium sp.]|nr:NADP-dependent oxidoreductase [Propionibacterium sp.]
MRAVVIDEPGGPEKLRIARVPTPVPGPGEVLVEVAHAGVNPADWKTREGWLDSFFDYTFPFVLGYDMSGTVAACGPDVAGFTVGDRVVAYSHQIRGTGGSYAEFALADAARVAVLPDTVSSAVAASVPVPGVTACEAVFVVGDVRAGQKVLVNGASGGLGSYAVQLCRDLGAEVAATCSAANHDYVRDLGAHLVIDYRSEDVAAAVLAWAPDGVDLVIDAVGQGTLPDAVRMTRDGGCVAPIGTLIADEPGYDEADAARRGVRVHPTMSNYERSGQHLNTLVGLLASGRLRAPEVEVLPMEQVRRAQERVRAGHVRGKLVLRIGGDRAEDTG